MALQGEARKDNPFEGMREPHNGNGDIHKERSPRGTSLFGFSPCELIRRRDSLALTAASLENVIGNLCCLAGLCRGERFIVLAAKTLGCPGHFGSPSLGYEFNLPLSA